MVVFSGWCKSGFLALAADTKSPQLILRALSLVSELAAKTYGAGSFYQFWAVTFTLLCVFSVGIALKNTEESCLYSS